MTKKPLTAYDPNSPRSRLAISDLVMPYRNASAFEVGDRTQYNPKSVFRSMYQSQMCWHDCHDYVSNPGIVAQRARWRRTRTQD